MGAIRGLRRAVDAYNQTALILRIAVGIVLGIALAFLIPGAGWIGMLGDLFVGALRAIAPLLVFLLVISALSQGGAGFDRRFSMVIFFYLFRKEKLGIGIFYPILVVSYCYVNQSTFHLPAILALIPILLYNGKKGKSMKYFFYVFYPLHMLLLAFLKLKYF